jgi:Ca2+-binding RTX toxin-like protein
MTLSGGIGNDTMNGGNGSDTFVFASGFGDDVIRDLDANPAGGQDFLDISAFGITSVADFSQRVAIDADGRDMLVTIDANPDQTIRLVGINSTDVTITDFLLFHAQLVSDA